MAFQFDDLSVSHQLVIGSGFPIVPFRVGPEKVRGAASIEGPAVIGSPSGWPFQTATLMVGPDNNVDTPPAVYPGAVKACGLWNNSPYSFHVVGNAVVNDHVDVALDVNAGGFLRAGLGVQSQGDVFAFCGAHRLSDKKNFDIPHPTKKGWRLRHTCLEGPSNDVYIRGKLKNSNEINLPEYWKELVDVESITTIAGSFKYTSFGIPGGKVLLSPIQQAMTNNPNFINITPFCAINFKIGKIYSQIYD